MHGKIDLLDTLELGLDAVEGKTAMLEIMEEKARDMLALEEEKAVAILLGQGLNEGASKNLKATVSFPPNGTCVKTQSFFSGQHEASVMQACQGSPFVVRHLGDKPSQIGGIWSFSMNVASGKCLQTQLSNAPQPYSEAATMYFLVQIFAGLWHMHKQGFIHRDLKPANIFCDNTGGVWVADLGFSIRAEKARDILGTPSYMAPEIWRGQGYSQNVDVWALGISLYQLLTKQLPFSGPTIQILAENITQKPFVFPPALITKYNISPSTVGLVSWMLTKDCSQRPSLDQIIATPFMQNAFAQLAKMLEEKPGSEEKVRNLRSCAYNAAITAGVAGYNAYITAAGNTNQGAEARRAYNAAIAAGVADVSTHNAYITAANNTGQREEAIRAFNATVVHGDTNTKTREAYAQVISRQTGQNALFFQLPPQERSPSVCHQVNRLSV
ncbi:protein kinase [Legionella lytica]|uniref:Protein kinase n=1 Tax=Legionella lytica TaxID=96232 RepID=A0ABW8D924_9GAMM